MKIFALLSEPYKLWILIYFLHYYQPVRRGTNGGVTKAGLLAATAAGSIIGLTFVLLGFFTTKCTKDVVLKQLLVIPISALAGLCGSVIDSLLGATLQFSGFCTVRNKVMPLHILVLNLIVISVNITWTKAPRGFGWF